MKTTRRRKLIVPFATTYRYEELRSQLTCLQIAMARANRDGAEFAVAKRLEGEVTAELEDICPPGRFLVAAREDE